MENVLLITACILIVLAGVISYLWFLRDLFVFIKSWYFWIIAYNNDVKAFDYFIKSPSWSK